MTLTTFDPPEGLRENIENAFMTRFANQWLDGTVRIDGSVDTVTSSLPLPYYPLAADQALTKKDLTNLGDPPIWKFFFEARDVNGGESSPFAIAMASRDVSGRYVYSGTIQGRFVEQFVSALKEIERTESIVGPERNYKVALLFFPSLYVGSIWLRSVDGISDKSIILQSSVAFLAGTELSIGEVIELTDFLDLSNRLMSQ